MRYSNDENDDDSTDFLQDPLSPFHDDADDDDAYNDDFILLRFLCQPMFF